MPDDFDLIVLGTGSGGLTAASEAQKLGAKVAMVSNDRPGGDCSYYGCVPTKTLIQSAKVLDYIRRAPEYGLPKVDVEPDFARVMAHKDRIVDEITAKGAWEPWEEQGFAVYKGTGVFQTPHELRVDGRSIRAEKFVLGVGTQPLVPPLPGLREAGYLTNVEAVALRTLPRRLLIVGAGPIGLEFAQLFARLGSQVTVVELLDRIAPKEDAEVAAMLRGYLEEEGIAIHTGTRMELVEKNGDAKVVIASADGDELHLEADDILVAAGRKPPTSDIGLEKAGVELENGWVWVDETLRTSAPNIWAVGDCTGKFLFTHVADYHARVVAHNIQASGDAAKRVDYRVLPWATFTDPELARVGLTEAEAEEHGLKVKVARMNISDAERSHMMLEQKGMIKVVADEENRLLGATILGPRADDLIHELAVAIKAGMKSDDLLHMIHAYPTLSEAVRWSMWGLEEPESVGV